MLDLAQTKWDSRTRPINFASLFFAPFFIIYFSLLLQADCKRRESSEQTNWSTIIQNNGKNWKLSTWPDGFIDDAKNVGYSHRFHHFLEYNFRFESLQHPLERIKPHLQDR